MSIPVNGIDISRIQNNVFKWVRAISPDGPESRPPLDSKDA